MQNQLTENEKKVVAFLKGVKERTSSADVKDFYHDEIEQTEYPNAVTKNTTVRNMNDLKAASERGSKILQKEEYEIKNLYSINDSVILEAIWKGTLAVPVGNIATGEIMKAYFAQVFEFKDGKIFRQRNYDCFEPFS